METIDAADLDDLAIEKLESGLCGRILRAGDADYDVARSHYNALINKHPVMIVQCAGVADVIDAVNFARTHRVLVAVRGGGHNVAGRALVDAAWSSTSPHERDSRRSSPAHHPGSGRGDVGRV